MKPMHGVLLLAALAAAGRAAAAEPAPEPVGSETCGVCHEEVVAAFARTPHHVAAGWSAETGCESCHGPGGAHVDSEGDPERIVRPQELPPRERSATCLACHARQARAFTSRHAIHDVAGVACTDCHAPHSTASHMLERRGRALCAECHAAVDAQADMARSHPVDDCTACHDPHASRAPRNDPSAGRERCVACHFEKAGPFVYEHDVALLDGCVSCHDVHGSPNRHLLGHETQVNLCYQCHSAEHTPSFHNATRFFSEKCTACHTAIHGSNTHPFFLEE